MCVRFIAVCFSELVEGMISRLWSFDPQANAYSYLFRIIEVFTFNFESTLKNLICRSHESGNPVFMRDLDSRFHGNDTF